MKKIILSMILLPTLLFGQRKTIELGISVGNNGQLDKTLNDFYFWGHETAYLDDSYQDETTNLKFSVSGRYFFSDNVSARLKYGIARRKDFYTKIDPTGFIEYNIEQVESNVSPSICFSKSFDKLEIMTGFEIPLIFVGDFTMNNHYGQMQDSITINSESRSKVTMTGGFIWGINNFIGIKYFFTNWFGMGTEINYGLLFADIGDKVNMESETTIPSTASSTYQYDKHYKKTFFSTPEVSLGIFFRLGGK